MYPTKHEIKKQNQDILLVYSKFVCPALYINVYSIFGSIIILFLESNTFAPYGKHTGFCKPPNISIIER